MKQKIQDDGQQIQEILEQEGLASMFGDFFFNFNFNFFIFFKLLFKPNLALIIYRRIYSCLLFLGYSFDLPLSLLLSLALSLYVRSLLFCSLSLSLFCLDSFSLLTRQSPFFHLCPPCSCFFFYFSFFPPPLFCSFFFRPQEEAQLQRPCRVVRATRIFDQRIY